MTTAFRGGSSGHVAFLTLVSPLVFAPPAYSEPYPAERHEAFIQECLEASRDLSDAAAAGAPGEADSASPKTCIGKSAEECLSIPGNESNQAVSGCYHGETAVWDQLLNDRYRDLREVLTPEAAEKLREIQRAWMTWRDLKCEFPRILHDGGTMSQPMSAYCVMELTAERAIELGELLDEAATR